ncbi:MAG: winged helix-turn-helix transcriptional regulator [Fibrobacter sp.]|uniref:ArsR/SmtB family transcription factor n=1 Tax=Fibrobacter sp. TaxID=35828 RepID=UPI001B13BADF|nr:metalloregulator ArsR/SmtB family transcription factor [Fibrobacter sp.]MBO7061721.1 winged helix-turn-helix transcriptional regulator [Fibrobacter sp.]MBO7512862.1 winged helix-turn-helix transcriptional regulator [Fibrobacter sp.]
MTDSEIALICKALSDENRVKIVRMLTRRELCACEILEKLAVTQPTLSHHMKILADSGLVSVRKEGKWSYYAIRCEQFQTFKAVLNEICCTDGAESADGSQRGYSCCCEDGGE